MNENDKQRQELEDFEERVAEILHRKHNRRWTALWIWMVVFTIAVILVVDFGISANSARIDDINKTRAQRLRDIQKSRITSCKANYDGSRKLLVVTFNKLVPIKTRTPQQKAQFKKFGKAVNQTANNLKSECKKQTRLPR